jgi:hypothetical protein
MRQRREGRVGGGRGFARRATPPFRRETVRIDDRSVRLTGITSWGIDLLHLSKSLASSPSAPALLGGERMPSERSTMTAFDKGRPVLTFATAMRAHAANILRKQEGENRPSATPFASTRHAGITSLPVIPHVVRRTTGGPNAMLVRAAARALRAPKGAFVRNVIGGILLGTVIAFATAAVHVRPKETTPVELSPTPLTVSDEPDVTVTEEMFARDPQPLRVEARGPPFQPVPIRPVTTLARHPRGWPARGSHLATSRTFSHKPTRR